MRAHATMMGTSLHTLIQMVDNGLGLTFVPAMRSMPASSQERASSPPAALEPRLSPGSAGVAPVEPARPEFRLLADLLAQIAAARLD